MVLVPRAFQKYSICMVYSEFLFSGRNPTLEGRGGGTTGNDVEIRESPKVTI